MVRKRAYPGAIIVTNDGRTGRILSTFSDGFGSWLIWLDASDGHDEGDLIWMKRSTFRLIDEQS
jgi:hypothetical protein